MHHPTDRIVHTTAFVTPVVEHWLEREIDATVDHTDKQRENNGVLLSVSTARSYRICLIYQFYTSSYANLIVIY